MMHGYVDMYIVRLGLQIVLINEAAKVSAHARKRKVLWMEKIQIVETQIQH
jgi:hypothetical protein